MHVTRRNAATPIALWAAAVMLGTALPALADARDISVGGVYICTITQDAAGYSSYDRATQINQRITQVLSTPRFRGGATVSVQPAGAAATISVGDLLVFAVMPQDVAGTHMSTIAVARQWARSLAKGLGQAIPGSQFHF